MKNQAFVMLAMVLPSFVGSCELAGESPFPEKDSGVRVSSAEVATKVLADGNVIGTLIGTTHYTYELIDETTNRWFFINPRNGYLVGVAPNHLYDASSCPGSLVIPILGTCPSDPPSVIYVIGSDNNEYGFTEASQALEFKDIPREMEIVVGSDCRSAGNYCGFTASDSQVPTAFALPITLSSE